MWHNSTQHVDVCKQLLPMAGNSCILRHLPYVGHQCNLRASFCAKGTNCRKILHDAQSMQRWRRPSKHLRVKGPLWNSSTGHEEGLRILNTIWPIAECAVPSAKAIPKRARHICPGCVQLLTHCTGRHSLLTWGIQSNLSCSSSHLSRSSTRQQEYQVNSRTKWD